MLYELAACPAFVVKVFSTLGSKVFVLQAQLQAEHKAAQMESQRAANAEEGVAQQQHSLNSATERLRSATAQTDVDRRRIQLRVRPLHAHSLKDLEMLQLPLNE